MVCVSFCPLRKFRKKETQQDTCGVTTISSLHLNEYYLKQLTIQAAVCLRGEFPETARLKRAPLVFGHRSFGQHDQARAFASALTGQKLLGSLFFLPGCRFC